MSKTTLYLIRHGESEGNARRAFLGHTDLDITELGHNQAEQTAKYLNGIHADKIYSSDLIRAYNTALHTARKRNMGIIKNSNLREINAGDWENVTFDELMERYHESFVLWRTNVGRAKPDNGESVLDLQTRIISELKKLSAENMGNTIFIFTHATPIRAFRAYCDGCTPDEIKDIPWASNASVTKAEYEDGKFTLISYGESGFMDDMVTTLPHDV